MFNRFQIQSSQEVYATQQIRLTSRKNFSMKASTTDKDNFFRKGQLPLPAVIVLM